MAHCYPDLAGDVDVISDSEVGLISAFLLSNFLFFIYSEVVNEFL